jgi:hypothetical protein
VAEFDADALGKRLDELNKEHLAALEQISDRMLRELEAHRLGPKRADGTEGRAPSGASESRRERKEVNVK